MLGLADISTAEEKIKKETKKKKIFRKTGVRVKVRHGPNQNMFKLMVK